MVKHSATKIAKRLLFAISSVFGEFCLCCCFFQSQCTPGPAVLIMRNESRRSSIGYLARILASILLIRKVTFRSGRKAPKPTARHVLCHGSSDRHGHGSFEAGEKYNAPLTPTVRRLL